MWNTAFLASLFLAPLTIGAPAVDIEERQAPCQNLHIFLASGTDEPYPGRQSSLASAICNGLTSCGYKNINYPANFNTYCTSIYAGITGGLSQITAYANRCSNFKMVLSGYSQGAQLLGDILGGGGGQSVGCTQQSNPVLNPATSPGNKIAAALFFGDPRHAANQAYNTGTGVSRSGINPRNGAQLTSLNRFSSVLRSWCLAGDNVCAQGTDPTAHTSYFNVFSQEAGAWVKTKV
ncbi:carbohydrate esterase family 5 [Fusarium sporotrichioides]|uniref:Carbohydrate esterase family 5 n=1 Tax=Fusarium sporotrichioides TaxID=5514 RepID=A0A395SV45_FUSSP|nr:carbohydrate esterase family 5 [Fusarium sporotrichioides]